MNCPDRTLLVDFLDPERPRHAAARGWMAMRAEEPMYAPTFVFWEILRGAARLDGVAGVQSLHNELEWLTPLPLSVAAAVVAATIEAECRARGEEIDAADYVIAGTVRNAGAPLVTADPDFERVEGLDLVWYDD